MADNVDGPANEPSDTVEEAGWVEVKDPSVTEGSANDLPSDEVAPLDTFARRLDYLFRTVHPRGAKPYSFEHVAEAITAEHGIDISANYIWMLRAGRRDNPTLRHIEGLAHFFGVSPAFLSDPAEAERIRVQLDKLSDLAGSGIRHVSLRAQSVDEGTLDVIHSLLDRVKSLTEALRTPAEEPPTVRTEPPNPEPKGLPSE